MAGAFLELANKSDADKAFEFLKVPDETGDIEVYTEKRKMLKNFIRHKVKNNNRKKIHFKKKLGGLKKTFKTKLK
ncbi:hypothetical protein J6590_007725 [Homalodisca vitripennis]|nr:hypothetical protein J6590_007725 [Homalodisca vitripennis]